MTVAILGAGPAGLVAVKEALAVGLQPTGLDMAPQIGGLWKTSHGHMWDSMKTNICRYSCSFSDHPHLPKTADFPSQLEMFRYLCSYALRFKLMEHIRLNAEVKQVERSGEKWKVTWKEDRKNYNRLFDFLIVAVGAFTKPYIPCPRDGFTGEILHSAHYKNPELFKNKNVVIIGNSFSGSEIAAEMATVAAKVTHVASGAFWIVPRYLPKEGKQVPLDFVFYNRKGAYGSVGSPEAEILSRKNKWLSSIATNALSPKLAYEKPYEESPFVIVSDTYSTSVAEGKIDLRKGRVVALNEKGVKLQGGDVFDADSIIFATGYQFSLPFLTKDLLAKLEFDESDRLQPLLLHMATLHPEFTNGAFVGMYRGPYFGVMELQARLAMNVFSGKALPPTEEEFNVGLAGERAIRNRVPRMQFPHSDYVIFSDKLAKAAGVLPNLEELKNSDPEAYKKLWEGFFIPANYRLTGTPEEKVAALAAIDEANAITTKLPQS